jgi:hypothetical protein
MSSYLSTAAPSSNAASLNSSWRRCNDMLPYEILSSIFSYISHSHVLHLRHLLFVCRSWSLVVLQEAELWSSIRIDHELDQYFLRTSILNGAFKGARAANFISLCIFRSEPHPLSIVLDFRSFMVWSRLLGDSINKDLFPLLRNLVGPLGQHALRWHSFEWHSMAQLDRASEIISILPHHLPQLKYLRLYQFQWDQRNGLVFPRCPSLEVVELHEHQEYEMQLFDEYNCSIVKELLIESRWAWHPEDLRYIASFRSVLRLTLSSSHEGAHFELEAPEKIHLPQLKDLRLKGFIHLNLIGLLNAPSLNKVEFDHNESINSILSHLVSTDIETIAALIPAPSPVSLHVTVATALKHLVVSLHALKLLRVKRWIYDLMKASDYPLGTSGASGHGIQLIIED